MTQGKIEYASRSLNLTYSRVLHRLQTGYWPTPATPRRRNAESAIDWLLRETVKARGEAEQKAEQLNQQLADALRQMRAYENEVIRHRKARVAVLAAKQRLLHPN